MLSSESVLVLSLGHWSVVHFKLEFSCTVFFSFATNTQCSAPFVKKIILATWILEIKLRSLGTSIAPVYFLRLGLTMQLWLRTFYTMWPKVAQTHDSFVSIFKCWITSMNHHTDP